MGCHALLQGIFPTQGWNPRILRLQHWQMDSLLLIHLESLKSYNTQQQKGVLYHFSLLLVCCCSDAKLCLTICNPVSCIMPGFSVLRYLPEFAQMHVHWVSDAIQPLDPLLPPSFGLNLSQHQGLFQWVSSSHQVAKVLELQLQHQSFQWISGLISFRIDCFDLLAVQGTLKSLLQHHISRASVLWCSAFFMVQL